jgi:hypothetical protein
MRTWLTAPATALAIVVALSACGGGGGDGLAKLAGAGPRESEHAREAGHEAKVEIRDPDRGGKPGANPNSEAYQDRALPRGYITAENVRAARSDFLGRPLRLHARDFEPGTSSRDAEDRGFLRDAWQFLGPSVGFAPGPTTESLRDSITSGRITALAVDPNCGRGQGCRLWVAAAGGGVWRTGNGLDAQPSWTAVNDGLPTNALGSLIVDPTDARGNTLYAGTGEANAINQAGLGVYKSTDAGNSWRLVPGSFAVTKDRSVGAIAVDPTDPRTVWVGTALGTQGQSSVNGGSTEPPGAPTLGVYRSTDGGQSFSLAFSQPGTPSTALGGVTNIQLDPASHTTVYASLFGYGVWRTAPSLEGGDASWKQVFRGAQQNTPVARFERTEYSLTRAKDSGGVAHTRIYLGDGGFDPDFNTYGHFFRTDNADRPAVALAGGGTNPGWTKLSSETNGDPGYASNNLCQGQCDYDLFVVADPKNPDVVWFGGSMVYEEIRPLQDQSLEGLAPNRSNGRSVMRSQDAGVHFTDMTADTETPHYEQMHPDQHAIVFDPQNTNIAFVGSDGGIVRTDGTFDDASSQCDTRDGVADSPVDLAECRQWLSKIPHRIVNMNAGLATLQFVDLSFDPRVAGGDLLGGTQDNGTFALSGSPRSWFESVNGDGGPAGFDAADPNVRVHTFFVGLADVNHHGADPLRWTFMSQPVFDSGENVSFYTPLITDPRVSGTIFIGAQHIWRTKDNGGDQAQLEAHCAGPGGVPQYDGAITCGDFQPLGDDLTTGPATDRGGSFIATIARAPGDTHTMWVSTRRGRLFVTHNVDATDPAAVTFTRIDTPTTPSRFISGIAVDPANPDHAFVSYSGYNAATPTTPGHVFDVSFDARRGRATFRDISADVGDQPITDVALDAPTGDLYAATDYGVLRRPDRARHWGQAAGGLPLASVPGLSIDTRGRLLYAATYGRSAFRLRLPAAARRRR